jgi:hypothetical protein
MHHGLTVHEVVLTLGPDYGTSRQVMEAFLS